MKLKINKSIVVLVILIFLILIGYLFYINSSKNSKVSTSNINPPGDLQSIPVYPGSTLVQLTSDPTEGKDYSGFRYTKVWSTIDGIPTVAKWYSEKLLTYGWTLDIPTADPNDNSVQYYTYFNSEYSLYMSYTKDPGSGKTIITAGFSHKLSDLVEPGEEPGAMPTVKPKSK